MATSSGQPARTGRQPGLGSPPTMPVHSRAAAGSERRSTPDRGGHAVLRSARSRSHWHRRRAVTNPLRNTCSPRGLHQGEGAWRWRCRRDGDVPVNRPGGSTRPAGGAPGRDAGCAGAARRDRVGAVGSHDGVVFSTMGDGMAAVSASAREAVRAVPAAQRGLGAEGRGEVTGPLAARMGCTPRPRCGRLRQQRRRQLPRGAASPRCHQLLSGLKPGD